VARLYRAWREAVAADIAAGDDEEGGAAYRAREAALEALVAAPAASMRDLAIKIIVAADIASAGEALPQRAGLRRVAAQGLRHRRGRRLDRGARGSANGVAAGVAG
jgi:hypothetical protein